MQFNNTDEKILRLYLTLCNKIILLKQYDKLKTEKFRKAIKIDPGLLYLKTGQTYRNHKKRKPGTRRSVGDDDSKSNVTHISPYNHNLNIDQIINYIVIKKKHITKKIQ